MTYESHPIEDWPRDHFAKPANRKPFFGTSHTAVLFNEHPFQTAAEYWLDKARGRRPDPATPAMLRGTYLEDGIVRWWAETLDPPLDIVPTQAFTRGHLIAIPDRYVSSAGALVSVKSTRRHLDQPEPYWIYQAQAEMVASGIERMYIVWMDASQELQWDEIEFDYDLGVEIWNRSSEFMQSLADDDMPDWVAASHTADTVIRQYPAPSGVLDADVELKDLVAEYHSLKQQGREFEAAADHLRDRLFAAAKDNEVIAFDGTPIATLKAQKGRSGIDVKALLADHPELAEKYKYESPSTRALRIPKAAQEVLDG